MAGRPREFDRDEALTRIQAVFWARGYEGASMAGLVAATGLASARLYAAFGSKEQAFREAVLRYEAGEGGFADRALTEEPTARAAISRMLRDAVHVYTTPEARGCLVVTAATNCSATHATIRDWLAEHRRARTDAIVARLHAATSTGELAPGNDPQALGDALATVLHGLSVQARDGIPAQRLLAATRTTVNALLGPEPNIP